MGGVYKERDLSLFSLPNRARKGIVFVAVITGAGNVFSELRQNVML
jgi:hypothetical protein